jgi:glycerol-3-phosphate dehydrogenase (NAD(P)+)
MSEFVTVIGTGSWGTTLALLVARKNIEVRLWTRTPAEADLLKTEGENKRFLPGIKFPPTLQITADLEYALAPGCQLVIFAAPTSKMRDSLRQTRALYDALAAKPVVISAAKGLEQEGLLRITQVMEQELPAAAERKLICALSGPNIAKELAEGKPGATVVAGINPEATTRAQRLINSTFFRVYTNEDVIGVELGGALKNIIALGAGAVDGLNAGDNAKGAFMTRGIAEIGRLGVAAGANPLTFLGLAGLGDLVTTCASPHSRNRYVGQEIAKGRSWDEIKAGMSQVAEGVYTTAAACKMSSQYNLEMPITRQIFEVLFENKPAISAIRDLMLREPTREMYGFDAPGTFLIKS